MPNQHLDRSRYRELLEKGHFRQIFNELGWDNLNIQPLELEGFTFSPVAQKRGFQVFKVSPDENGEIPNKTVKTNLEREISKLALEHLLIFTNSAQTIQAWQWARREHNQPVRLLTEDFRHGSNGEPLIQRLEGIQFSFAEEDNLTIQDASNRVKRTFFNLERATSSFFKKFQIEHNNFLAKIDGLPENLKSWYTSLMLNRLMFVYFVQKKGFLDNDTSYLRDRLEKVQKLYGSNKFHSFYRDFLLVLFHKGLGSNERPTDPEMKKLLGDIPYLNGGLFEEHDIEKSYLNLQIPDEAFDSVLSFFERFKWHLDNRPNRNDKEINPDMLGYIFEKYINQKQMGAYYTKEDITEYISKNTVLPYVLETTRTGCKVAFEGENSVWKALQQNPNRYIYPAVQRGVDVLESDLPDFVQAGMHDPKARMFERRYNLGDAQLLDKDGNTATLPTETWREYITRRNRCLELRAKLKRGEVQSVEDLITHNLDIRQFAQDVLDNAETADLVRAFWKAIKNISVLDPTCGSGAFLFAALNILQPLYQSALEKMREFVREADELEQPKKYPDFRETLLEIDKHPNEKYFVLKSIIVNNLYGVDIMEEAVEIAKLRLFLKLMSEVERPDQIEPLPDVDFNIRAGNTLVGYATEAEVDNALENTLDLFGTKDIIKQKLEDVDKLFEQFKTQQTKHGGAITPANKRVLRDRLSELSEELNQHLADQYTPELSKKPKDYKKWKESHKPFHWFVDFHGIMKNGGFDAVIGNPPYVEYSKVRGDYTVLEDKIETFSCGNLFALVSEIVLKISKNHGYTGLIVLLAGFGTTRMKQLQSLYKSKAELIVASHYEATSHPSVIFVGVEAQLSIIITKSSRNPKENFFTTNYMRTYSQERDFLFERVRYSQLSGDLWNFRMPRLHDNLDSSIIRKLYKYQGKSVVSASGESLMFRSMGNFFWKLAFTKEPTFLVNGVQERSSTLSSVLVSKPKEVAQGLIYSSLFYYFWVIFSDVYHLTKTDIELFPIDIKLLGDLKDIVEISNLVQKSLFDTAKIGEYSRKKGNYTFHRFFPHATKPEIDKIDLILSRKYGFTDDELDFIINYDIKYRMGRDAADETDGA